MSFLIAHRGHSAKAPENTVAAFRAAADAGFQWIETDADMLADGTIVLIHDSSFKRTGKVAARVSASQIEDLAEIDVGRWFSQSFADTRVPTLRDLVDLMNSTGLNVNLELKLTDPNPERIGTYIHAVTRELERVEPRGDKPRVIVSSFNHPLLATLHLAVPRLRLACLFERSRFTLTSRHSGWREIAHSTGATYVHPHHRELNERIVEWIHSEGLEINTWTVNNPGRAAELAGWGVDGICTDGPKGLTPNDAPAALRHTPATRPETHQSGSAKTHP
ncbi:glycerophosphodiester phosphodiesterase family protein [Rothia uropygialis]|uniref:glycerophosphodiester phosphodiesterase family protein n=1 Tax=Kocuria sp. 36 TaxID=1415402 RepID=UPI0013EADC88|nr:glycerophosphodiester phosphodiesterase family protein [Kocuria sp. 36]